MFNLRKIGSVKAFELTAGMRLLKPGDEGYRCPRVSDECREQIRRIDEARAESYGRHRNDLIGGRHYK